MKKKLSPALSVCFFCARPGKAFLYWFNVAMISLTVFTFFFAELMNLEGSYGAQFTVCVGWNRLELFFRTKNAD